jgi:phosphoglycerate dehydrogenase-like enzyme
VVFTPARNADSVADFVLGVLLSTSRGIAAAERHLRSQGWHVDGELPYLHFRGRGAGRPGPRGRRLRRRRTARDAARSGRLRHDGAVHDPYVDGGVPFDEPARALRRRVAALPPLAGTAALLDEAALRRMRRGSVLINTAGGGMVDEAARCGRCATVTCPGGARRLRERAAAPRLRRCSSAPNLLLTPHLAGRRSTSCGTTAI